MIVDVCTPRPAGVVFEQRHDKPHADPLATFARFADARVGKVVLDELQGCLDGLQIDLLKSLAIFRRSLRQENAEVFRRSEATLQSVATVRLTGVLDERIAGVRVEPLEDFSVGCNENRASKQQCCCCTSPPDAGRFSRLVDGVRLNGSQFVTVHDFSGLSEPSQE